MAITFTPEEPDLISIPLPELEYYTIVSHQIGNLQVYANFYFGVIVIEKVEPFLAIAIINYTRNGNLMQNNWNNALY